MKKLWFIIWLWFGALVLQAQTPFDSFAPETSRQILDERAIAAEQEAERVKRESQMDTIVCAAVIDLENQVLLLVDVNEGAIVGVAPLTDEIRKWLSVDPLVDKNISTSPYMYCDGNPIIFVDPDGMDEEQREAALTMAHRYVDMNPGDSYELGARGYPGEKVDCSGMVSRCIIAGGEEDPIMKGTGNGVRRIANQAETIEDINDIMAGNLVTFDTGRAAGKYSHIGIISDVARDNDGNVVGFHFIHSGSKGPSIGYSNTNYWKSRITGFYKWDMRPDVDNTPLYNGLSLQDVTVLGYKPIEATPLRALNVMPISVISQRIKLW